MTKGLGTKGKFQRAGKSPVDMVASDKITKKKKSDKTTFTTHVSLTII